MFTNDDDNNKQNIPTRSLADASLWNVLDFILIDQLVINSLRPSDVYMRW